MLRTYRRPVLIICALNLAALSLIALSWQRAETPAAPTPIVSCSLPSVKAHQSPVQLKMRATRIFETQSGVRTVSYGYLAALSSAMKFSLWERAEELLNEYDCGRTL